MLSTENGGDTREDILQGLHPERSDWFEDALHHPWRSATGCNTAEDSAWLSPETPGCDKKRGMILLGHHSWI